FQGLEAKEVFPHQISDVWAQRPLYIKGRYLKPGTGEVILSGFAGGRPYTQKLKLVLPGKESANEAISSVWGRGKVDRLMSEDYFGAQRGGVNKELKEEIIETALSHHIMTQYTSFVAVEEKVITDGGKPKTVAVPVEMPEGVTYENVFGDEGTGVMAKPKATASAVNGIPHFPAGRGLSGGYGAGYGGGGGGSVAGSMLRFRAQSAPSPVPAQPARIAASPLPASLPPPPAA